MKKKKYNESIVTDEVEWNLHLLELSLVVRMLLSSWEGRSKGKAVL
jgi:hypothetical protein